MYGRIAFLSILCFSLQHIIRLIYSLGFHLHFYQHYPGPCHQVEGIDYGSANFYTLPDGTTFVTSGLSMNAFSQSFHAHYLKNKIQGGIYLLNLQNTSSPVVPILLKISENSKFNSDSFRPHGISVWPDNETGQHIIYVVSHPVKGTDRIEKFHFLPDQKMLQHLKTYSDKKLRSVYDVQALGVDAFYATNILYEQKSRFFMSVELFSLMPWSTVVLYDGDNSYRDVVKGLTSATGIILSRCGMFVYILMCLGSEIRVYKRQEDNSLIQQQSFPLHTHPDSVALDPNIGDLFVGAHPIAHQFISHLDKPWLHKAASQVLHIRLCNGNISSVTELLYDDGHLISGSSVAVVYNKRLLIGSAVDKLVLCDVNVPI